MNYILRKHNVNKAFLIIPCESTFQSNINLQKECIISNTDSSVWTSCGKITNKYLIYHYVLSVSNSLTKTEFHLNQVKEFVKANNNFYPIRFDNLDFQKRFDNIQILCEQADSITWFTKLENSFYLDKEQLNAPNWNQYFQFLLIEEVPFLIKSQIPKFVKDRSIKMPELTMKKHLMILQDMYEKAYSYYLTIKIQQLLKEKEKRFSNYRYRII